MSRQFNGTNEYLARDSIALSGAPLTMACWFNTGSLTAVQYMMHLADLSQPDQTFGLQVRGDLGGDPVAFIVNDGTFSRADTTTGISANTWHHAGGVAHSATDRRAFIDGGSKGTNAVSATPTGLDRTSIGRAGDSTPSNYWTGRLAEAAIWNVALSDATMALLALGFSPLFFPQGLICYWPLIGDADQDWVGPTNLTAFNTPTVLAHPNFIVHPSIKTSRSIANAATQITPTTVYGLGSVNSPTILSILTPTTIFSFGAATSGNLSQIFTIPNQRPQIVTPGLAEYKVRLLNQTGEVVAEFDTWRSLNFTHKVNRRGTIRFEVNGQDSRINLFDLDGQLEVWRRNPIVGLDWYLEWEGLYRTNNDMFYQNDSNSFVAYGFSYADLLRRAYIMYFAGTAQATKNSLAETAMKELVSENIGSLALISNSRQADNVFSGLTIQADVGAGATWEGSVENQKLLDVLTKISTFSFQQDEPIDFDIVGTGPATFQFRTYAGQRGVDRTKNNAAGNSAVIFSTGFGNMIIPVLKENRSSEITAAYALGRGVDGAQQIQLAESLDQNDSPWNRIETIARVSSPSGEDQVGPLLTGARATLEKNKFDPRLGFNVLQLEGTYYGKDYSWGDKTTAVFKTQEFNKKLVDIGITVSDNVGGEQIQLTFADI